MRSEREFERRKLWRANGVEEEEEEEGRQSVWQREDGIGGLPACVCINLPDCVCDSFVLFCAQCSEL